MTSTHSRLLLRRLVVVFLVLVFSTSCTAGSQRQQREDAALWRLIGKEAIQIRDTLFRVVRASASDHSRAADALTALENLRLGPAFIDESKAESSSAIFAMAEGVSLYSADVIVVANYGEEAGIFTLRKSAVACSRFFWSPGIPNVSVEDRPCPEALLNTLALDGVELSFLKAVGLDEAIS